MSAAMPLWYLMLQIVAGFSVAVWLGRATYDGEIPPLLLAALVSGITGVGTFRAMDFLWDVAVIVVEVAR